MFKNLTRPRWIALTVFLLVFIYLFIRLANWQFDRYDQRILRNEQATSALSSAPKNIDSTSQLSEMKQWEKVEINGTYLNDIHILNNLHDNKAILNVHDNRHNYRHDIILFICNHMHNNVHNIFNRNP